MKWRRIVVVMVVVIAATKADGYVLWGEWASSSARIYYGKLPASSPAAYQAAFVTAANRWNNATDFSFLTASSYIGSCDSYGGRLLNGVEFWRADCNGVLFSATTYAVTECVSVAGVRSACGITFNDGYLWGVYDSTWVVAIPDFRRTALHELGHFLGLAHSNTCASILAPSGCPLSSYYDIVNLQPDDIAGVAAIYAPGALSVSPASGLASTGTVGGPFAPSSQAYTLRNTGGSTIGYSISEGLGWLQTSRTSGTLGANASVSVVASVTSGAASLGAGTHSGTLSFRNTTNGAGNTTRVASLTVLTPHTISFTQGPRGNPNPVASGASVALTVSASDSRAHALTYAWSSSCPALGGSGVFTNQFSRTPTWKSATNPTAQSRLCTIQVTTRDAGGLTVQRSYGQVVLAPEPSAVAAGLMHGVAMTAVALWRRLRNRRESPENPGRLSQL